MWNRRTVAVVPLLAGVGLFMLAAGTRAAAAVAAGGTNKPAEVRVPLTFAGGHDTDPRDGGRPVVLIAAGLGVKPTVFREAFAGVTPARDGKPTPAQAQANKAALLKALRPHGVTNERLDAVSDYYRYRPEKGELWRATPAKGYAIVEAGKVRKVVVTEPGSGYSSPPTVTAEGLEGVVLTPALRFDADLKRNGSVAGVEVAAPASQERKPAATRRS